MDYLLALRVVKGYSAENTVQSGVLMLSWSSKYVQPLRSGGSIPICVRRHNLGAMFGGVVDNLRQDDGAGYFARCAVPPTMTKS